MAFSTTVTSNFNNSSDANFRAWASAIDTAIKASTWVNNGDSGQIDLTTVTAPAVINTSQGYKIYNSNDAGGGLDAFYLKLEFGSGAVSATRPAIWVTLGFQGTDGAGNMLSTINPISTRTQIAILSNPAGASQQINFASGSGYICIACTGATAAESLIFSVERTKDSTLAFMNQLNIFGINGNHASTDYCQTINKSNAFPVSTVGMNLASNVAIAPNANTPVAGIVALGLLFGLAPGATSPSMNMFGVETAALGVYGDVITVPVLGVNHNYKLQQGVTFSNIASTVMLTRYE